METPSDYVHLSAEDGGQIPEWMRAMPGRPARTREESLLELIQHADRALNRALYATELEWQLALTLARCKIRKLLVEFGRDPS